MRALAATAFAMLLLVSAIRPAGAQPPRVNRFPMPRLALSLAIDFRSALAREHRRLLVAQMRAPTALRHQQMLSGGGFVPKAPPALYIMAYDRLQTTVLSVMQPRRQLLFDSGPGYVQAVSARPMFAGGGVGALVTFETSPRY